MNAQYTTELAVYSVNSLQNAMKEESRRKSSNKPEAALLKTQSNPIGEAEFAKVQS